MSFGPSITWPFAFVPASTGSPTGSRVLNAARFSKSNVAALEVAAKVARNKSTRLRLSGVRADRRSSSRGRMVSEIVFMVLSNLWLK